VVVVTNKGFDISFARIESAVVLPPAPTKASLGVFERRNVSESCILINGN
jgi:hypothetical protein